ncbi:MAG: GAF domain-containing protein [Chloroflexi bacterium]|nr:GAF domain-containing protein [Chloroflexota bacterium]
MAQTILRRGQARPQAEDRRLPAAASEPGPALAGARPPALVGRGGALGWGGGLLALAGLELAHLVVPGFGVWLWSASLAVAAAAALLCALAGDSREARYPASWFLVGAACAVLLLGLILERALAGVSGRGAIAVLDDLALLAPSALLTAAALLRLQDRFPWPRRGKLLLDAAIAGSGLVAGVLLVGQLSGQWGAAPGAAAALSLLYLAAYGGMLYTVAFAARDSGWRPVASPQGAFALGATAIVAAALLDRVELDAARLGLPQVGASLWGAGLFCFALGAVGVLRRPELQWHPTGGGAERRDDSRLRLVPAAAATLLALWLAGVSLRGASPLAVDLLSAALGLSALTGCRLIAALVENRLLLRRLRTAGQFEAQLRDLGLALNSSLELDRVLRLICRSGQTTLDADTVIIWMLDRKAQQLEAVEVAGPRQQEFRGRRLLLADRTALPVRVLLTGQSEIIQHVLSSRRANQFLSILMRAQCLLAVPIAKGRTRLGAIEFAHSRDREAFQAEHLAKAELLAAHAAVALENARLYEQVRRQLDVVSAQLEFSDAVDQALGTGEIARQLLRVLRERTGADRACVFLCESGSILPRLVADEGTQSRGDRAPRLSEAALAAFRSGESRRGSVELHGDEQPSVPAGVRAELAVPLSANDRTMGVIVLESRAPGGFSAHQERLVASLANHAALAISNLVLLDEARKVEALKVLDRMKSELLSTVSHELRTPLGSIKGYTSMLLSFDRKLKAAEKREYLRIIDEESDRLNELIANLLDMSRLEAGKLRIDRGPVTLRAVAEDVLRRAELRATGHTFVLDWPDNVEVQADARRILQVMHNLVENAIKYSPNGGEIVVRGAVQGQALVISVADQGAGIPESELERVFDRFHRVPGEMSRQVGGTGLGLAICRGLVEAHEGRIRVQSQVGVGTTFSFTLPLGSK